MAFEAEQFLTETLGAQRVIRRGDELVHACLLPWGPHEKDGKEPGASLNSEKLLYNCFKCGTGGTLLWATETILNINSAQARKLIQGTFQADEISPETFLNTLEQAWNSSPELAMPHYDVKLLNAWMCPTVYMDERGISREVQREMMTGLNKTATERIGDEVITQPRIVIPHVFKGVLRGWTMRLIDKRQVGTKYKHTEQFPKKSTLYNYDGAKKFDSVIVVESPMSVLWMKTHGIDNVVATFGAEVNPGQVALLNKWDRVVLFPDGDDAGYRALSREDDRGRIFGLVHDLRTEATVVDHGWDGERFNEKDPANYTADELRSLLESAVPTGTWGYRAKPKPKQEPKHVVGVTGSQEYWS
jgi:Toprim domain-containing protein